MNTPPKSSDWKRSRYFHAFMGRVSPFPTVPHLHHLADHMRDADKEEIRATLGKTLPLIDELTWAVNTSDRCLVVFEPDKQTPMAIVGACSFPAYPGVGFMWMHGTAGIEKYKHGFLRLGRYGVALFQECYHVLTCTADNRNELHLRWLEWVGFTRINQYPLHEGSPLLFSEYCLLGGEEHINL